MSATNNTDRSGKPATVRIATWSARHRWPVFVLWFVFTIGLFATSVAMGGTKTIQATQASSDTTELGIAESTFNASGSATPHEEFVLVVSSATVPATDPAFRSTVAGNHGLARQRNGCVGRSRVRPAHRPVRRSRPGRADLGRRHHRTDRRTGQRRCCRSHTEA